MPAAGWLARAPRFHRGGGAGRMHAHLPSHLHAHQYTDDGCSIRVTIRLEGFPRIGAALAQGLGESPAIAPCIGPSTPLSLYQLLWPGCKIYARKHIFRRQNAVARNSAGRLLFSPGLSFHFRFHLRPFNTGGGLAGAQLLHQAPAFLAHVLAMLNLLLNTFWLEPPKNKAIM